MIDRATILICHSLVFKHESNDTPTEPTYESENNMHVNDGALMMVSHSE